MARKPKGTGRKRIAIQKMENRNNLEVTFSKRRKGVYRKASELSLVCDAHVAVVIFSGDNTNHVSGEPSTEETIHVSGEPSTEETNHVSGEASTEETIHVFGEASTEDTLNRFILGYPQSDFVDEQLIQNHKDPEFGELSREIEHYRDIINGEEIEDQTNEMNSDPGDEDCLVKLLLRQVEELTLDEAEEMFVKLEDFQNFTVASGLEASSSSQANEDSIHVFGGPAQNQRLATTSYKHGDKGKAPMLD